MRVGVCSGKAALPRADLASSARLLLLTRSQICARGSSTGNRGLANFGDRSTTGTAKGAGSLFGGFEALTAISWMLYRPASGLDRDGEEPEDAQVEDCDEDLTRGENLKSDL